MFHRNCFQILLLNFRSSTETVSREDPQIDFAMETCFCTWERERERERGGGGGGEGGVHKNVSKILATINFSSGDTDGKFLSVWKNFIGNINLGQTSRLNFKLVFKQIWHPQGHSWLPIGTVRINYTPTHLGQDPILRVVCIIERTHFKLIIDLRLERRQGVEVWEKSWKSFR